MHERARDDQLLAHAVAVALDQLVLHSARSKSASSSRHPLLDGVAILVVEAGDESQELRAGELLVDEGAVGDEAELRLGRDRLDGEVDPRDVNRSGASARRIPAIMRSVVVLPAPFGPRKPNSSPLGTVRSMASTAVNPP